MSSNTILQAGVSYKRFAAGPSIQLHIQGTRCQSSSRQLRTSLRIAGCKGSGAPAVPSTIDRVALTNRAQLTPNTKQTSAPWQWFQTSQRALVAAAAAATLLSSTPAAAAQQVDAQDGAAPPLENVRRTLLETWGYVNAQYMDTAVLEHADWEHVLEESLSDLDKATDQDQAFAVIPKMLSHLDDQFTRIIPARDSSSWRADTDGQIMHIGIRLTASGSQGQLRVTYVADDSPAQRAGIREGDLLVSINGKPATAVTEKEVNPQLRKEAVLKMRRQKEDDTQLASMTESDLNGPLELEFNLAPEPIEVYPVHYGTLKGDDGSTIGYLQLKSFGQGSARGTSNAIRALQQKGATAYILDLRGNPGGLVNAGYDVARLLLGQDRIFCWIMDRSGLPEPVNLTDAQPLIDGPLVVLVNSSTASTSEVLAASLQDPSRALLIGEHTFGKGRTQRVIPMGDGSTLLVSNTRVTSPDQHTIDRVGLEPDIACRPLPTAKEAWKAAKKDARELEQDPCIRLAKRHFRGAATLQTAAWKAKLDTLKEHRL